METHFAGKATKKRQNSDTSTPSACPLHYHSMLNGETRKAPMLPDASSYQLERSRPPGELSSTRYSHKQPWADQHSPWTDRPQPREKREKKKLNKQQKKTCSKEGWVPWALKGRGAIPHRAVNKQAGQRRQEWQHFPSNLGVGNLVTVAVTPRRTLNKQSLQG
jgi:hypothetical protein